MHSKLQHGDFIVNDYCLMWLSQPHVQLMPGMSGIRIKAGMRWAGKKSRQKNAPIQKIK